jgi:hypothetical protein
MTFDGPVLAWVILGLLPIVLPVILALIVKLVFHQTGCLPLVILLALGLLLAFGIAAYLNSGGLTIKGQVMGKQESIVYHLDGSWDRKLVATVSYNVTPTEPTTTKSLDLAPSRFDEIHQGDFVLLRVPDTSSVFQIVRLEEQGVLSQVWYLLTDQPFLCCFVLGLSFVLAVRFILNLNLPTLFFLSTFMTVGAWWMANVGIPVWQESRLLFGSLNSYAGTVREIHPPYLGRGAQKWFSLHMFQASDLILVNILPVGDTDPIISVDQVDLGSAKLRPGQTVSVEYSAANPRMAIVPDATRNYVWKNGLLDTLFAVLILFGISGLTYFFKDLGGKPDGDDEGSEIE